MAIDPRTRYIQAKVLAVLGAALGFYFAGVVGLLGGAVGGYFGGLFLFWFLTPRWRGSGPAPPGHWRR